MSENGNYWSTLEGIATRIADIAHQFSWSSLAESVKGIFASEPEAKRLIWKTMGDPQVCPICDDLADSEYDSEDELVPDMPAHVLCRCYFEVEGDEDVPEN